MKHTTPCGLAVGATALDAYRKALACDPVSAFGSVIAFTVPVDDATADAVSSLFVECIVAPEFSDGAVEILGRKKNLRVLEGRRERREARTTHLDYKRVRGGVLVQERAPAVIDDTGWTLMTKRKPTDEEYRDLLFAWRAVASVKSNAIVLARDGATIGIGAGQMSRVDAAFLAAHKAALAGHETDRLRARLGRVLPVPRRRRPGGGGRRPRDRAAGRLGARRRGHRRRRRARHGDGVHRQATVPALGESLAVHHRHHTGVAS